MVITAMAEYRAGKREGVNGCGSYNYKQGGQCGLPQKKDLKKVREESMQISGRKSIL